jgi:hypothetical protein
MRLIIVSCRKSRLVDWFLINMREFGTIIMRNLMDYLGLLNSFKLLYLP